MSSLTSAPKLIVLSDDPDNAEVISELSCLPGKFDVLGIAYSVPDLLKLAAQKTTDVLLVDYFFRDGPISQRLEQFLESFSTVPILFLSNFPMLLKEVIRSQKSNGLISICQQPNSIDEYKNVANELLRLYEQTFRLGATG